MMDESFWNDSKNAKSIINENNQLNQLINTYKETSKQTNFVKETLDELKIQYDFDLHSMLEDEYHKALKMVSDFEVFILLNGPFDANAAFIEFHPGAGGTESQDWAEMLYGMYVKFCENNNYKVEVLDYTIGDEAGIKSVTIKVSGDNAYGMFKSEKGVHRLVRISPFDSSKRRHTSFASVDVSPVFEDIGDVTILDEDIRTDTYRASGAGGQHINKTDSAVRITHIPTGIVVSCQTERSQIQNRERCMNMLKSKLYQLEMEKKQKELQEIKGEQKLIEWGSQIRSYVFCPYNLVKDHRTNYETSDVEGVMNGDIKDFIYAYLKMGVKQND